jgi:hypothetical protein
MGNQGGSGFVNLKITTAPQNDCLENHQRSRPFIGVMMVLKTFESIFETSYLFR